MGWASGSGLAEDIWGLVREHIPKSKRSTIAKEFIEEFQDRDCDTIHECEQLCEDAYGTCDCGNILTRPDEELCWSCEEEQWEEEEEGDDE